MEAMTLAKGTMSICSSGCRFYGRWRDAGRRGAGVFQRCSSDNLNEVPSLFIQNFNRCMSLTSSLPKTDRRRFLKHLVNVYADKEKNIEFESLLKNQLIQSLLSQRMKILENIESLEELEQDQEMKKLVEEEKPAYENQLEEIDDELINLVLENMCIENYDNIILEITAGVGGQESMLFVKDLMGMYLKHLDYLRYDFELPEVDTSSEGGIRHGSISITGQGCFYKMRHEAGVHRVQRVPATEKSGRVHTSVVSVSVLPQPTEIEIYIDEKDLKVDTMRASGAGGQHVNTTDSAVRITHLPTGMVVTCQEGRSQIKNRKIALNKLRAKLYQERREKQLSNASSLRRQQMGLGLRNEKIRTYNYNQDRVTDHRLSNGTIHNLKGFLEGGEALNNLHEKLNQELKYQSLMEAIEKIK